MMTALFDISTTVRRPCVVCGLMYARATDAAHHLCAHCADDLIATNRHIAMCVASVAARIAAHHEAWAARQAALDDGTAARWTRLVQARATAEGRVVSLERGALGRGMPEARRRGALTAARAHLFAVSAKIARTAQEPGNPLAALIAEDQAFHIELQALLAEQERWIIAEQHADDALPF